MVPRVTDMARRRARRQVDAPTPTGSTSVDELTVPVSLVHESARIGRSRSVARRALARGRARRRILPPLVAGSGALLGSTMIGAWVFGQAPTATTRATDTAPAPTTTKPGGDDAQLTLDIAALQRIRQALAADEAAISGLTPSVGGNGTTAQPGSSALSRGTSASPTVGTGVPTGTAASLSPLPTLPGLGPAAPLGPLPTVPSTTVQTTAPPTHTTTGATVAVP